MQAGKLSHRVTIEKNFGTARDQYNQPIEDWRPHVEDVPASVTPLTGRELWWARQTQPDITGILVIPYVAGITSAMRADLGPNGRKLHFLSVLNVEERGVELRIEYRERV